MISRDQIRILAGNIEIAIGIERQVKGMIDPGVQVCVTFHENTDSSSAASRESRRSPFRRRAFRTEGFREARSDRLLARRRDNDHRYNTG